MDPNCAICGNPPKHPCDCERRSLIHAVEESERPQARASIHQDFRAREARRRADYECWRQDNGGRISRTELEEVEFELRRGINEDWRAAVGRYPDVLDYFYGLVGWTRSGGSGGGGGGGGLRRGERERGAYLTRRG
ncbi:unnamed protein product [Tuber aestivum]|uniref:Uncharacterized protein n=1 Tax=Tuber aestivum TaxID=59557 RepID=A0A292Q6T7_9PEZI|nr:unnamed protein product [Tuber aestivum]